MKKNISFFFDYASPYSYLGNYRLTKIARKFECEIDYQPVLLGAIFKATGNTSPMLDKVEARRQYRAKELLRFVKKYGCQFQLNSHFPINSILLMRCAHVTLELGNFETYHTTVMNAIWKQNINAADPMTLTKLLQNIGLPGEDIVARAKTPEIKNSLRKATDEAVARGIFGVPTFFCNDEMFFGADRLDFVIDFLTAEGRELNRPET